MSALEDQVRAVAESSAFSGCLRLRRAGAVELDLAIGMADRAHRIPATTGTRFAIASGSKVFTALVVMRLVEAGTVGLSTRVRDVLGADLPPIDDRVTIEHLLAHRSGIGDYLDEDLIEDAADYVMTRPVHELVDTDSFLPMLEGHAQVFEPGSAFAYNNGAYVVLALVAERVTGRSYHDLVADMVLRPAGMEHTAFLRSDELPGDAARGYLDESGLRTNVFHLPVIGNGDGGAYTSLDDIDSFWNALVVGRIVAPATLADMSTPRSADDAGRRYGLGLWLHETNDAMLLIGGDAGVSFRTAYRPATGNVVHRAVELDRRGLAGRPGARRTPRRLSRTADRRRAGPTHSDEAARQRSRTTSSDGITGATSTATGCAGRPSTATSRSSP